MTAQEQARIDEFRDRLQDTRRRTDALADTLRDVLSCPPPPHDDALDSVDLEDPDFSMTERRS